VGDGVELFEDVEDALFGGWFAVLGLQSGGGEFCDAAVEGFEVLLGGRLGCVVPS